MTLKDILDKDILLYSDLMQYFSKCGLNNITVNDLENIIQRFSMSVFEFQNFAEVYKIVSTKENNKLQAETNKAMRNWTIAIGIMTFAMLIISIFN